MTNLVQLQEIFNEIQDCSSKKYSENINKSVNLITKDDSFTEIIHILLSCKKPVLPGRIVLFLRRITRKKTRNTTWNISIYFEICRF